MSAISMSSSRILGLGALLLSSLLFSSCGNNALEAKKETGPAVTYPMGQGVQLGPLTYTVLETSWKRQLGGGPAAKIPKNRYLLVKMSITNGAGDTTPI